MLRIDAAIIRGQGETFVLVSVKRQVLDSSSDRKSALRVAESRFGIPAVLVVQDSNRKQKVWGRRDHLRFLSTCNLDTLRWKKYEFSDAESQFGSTDCTACYGTGEIECVQCEGRGWFWNQRLDIRERCPICNESGRVKCRSCG